MGGHSGGREASRLALGAFAASFVECILLFADEDLDLPCVLSGAVAAAQQAVVERAESTPALRDMGTTLAAAVLFGNKMFHVSVGDSRVYLWRDQALVLLTSDDTMHGELVKAGVRAPDSEPLHPAEEYLTRCLGIGDWQEPAVGQQLAKPGDTLLACTDGLWREALEEMRETLRALDHDATDKLLSRAANTLVRAALDNGGTDNISVGLARMNDLGHLRRKTWKYKPHGGNTNGSETMSLLRS
jgi:protein phosphatase